MRPARPWMLLLACLAWPAADAQPIYRCGDSYSQQPCAGATVLEPAPVPAAADRSQAGAATARDARLADSLERDRLRREAQAAPSGAWSVQPAAPTTPDDDRSTDARLRPRKPDLFAATVPGSRPAKHKAKDTAADKSSKAPKASKAAKGTAAGSARSVQSAPAANTTAARP